MKRFPVNRRILLGGAALALCSSLVVAQDAPESLLPPGFGGPAPAPASAPAAPSRSSAAPTRPSTTTTGPIIQPLPGTTAPSAPAASINLPADFPSIAEIEAMTTDEIDELLGLKPKFDIPASARRSMDRVGTITTAEGGFPSAALAGQHASIVRAAIGGNKGQVVSRWGHILLRRALSSRMQAPKGMSPVEFAALRAGLLNRMGEAVAARALVQDVDTANYSPSLTNAALAAYIATGDIVGTCPVVRLQGGVRKDGQWQLLQAICAAYAGEETSADTQLKRALSRGVASRIDVLLAQRFAGAAGKTRRTVKIEWEGVEELTPWRFALATALGIEIPEALVAGAGPYFRNAAATAPMLPLPMRAEGAAIAAERGILSSSAMIDLYSQIYADSEIVDEPGTTASRLRDAYVAGSQANRVAALQDIWGAGDIPYARQVLTARAAARITPDSDHSDSAAQIVASMLSAGLDRNALRWGAVVADGSPAWALLALAQPNRRGMVSESSLQDFIDDDASPEQRKSRFLLAGLAGLGRLDQDTTFEVADQLGVRLGEQTRWTRLIDKAAKVRNPALVSLLAGVGMQGTGWDKMTARHLYHIVSALRRVGLDAEARMIAAEAVARG